MKEGITISRVYSWIVKKYRRTRDKSTVFLSLLFIFDFNSDNRLSKSLADRHNSVLRLYCFLIRTQSLFIFHVFLPLPLMRLLLSTHNLHVIAIRTDLELDRRLIFTQLMLITVTDVSQAGILISVTIVFFDDIFRDLGECL